MPNVPQAPGVPPLPGYGPGGIALLEADAIEVLALGLSAISPQWGIYLNGAPIIQPSSVLASTLSLVAPVATPQAAALGIGFPIFASFVDFEYKQDWTISDYTVEQGGFQSYNKVQLAFDVRVRVASGGTASVITEPAARYAPSPISMGATSVELLPTKTLLPMVVLCLFTPS